MDITHYKTESAMDDPLRPDGLLSPAENEFVFRAVFFGSCGEPFALMQDGERLEGPMTTAVTGELPPPVPPRKPGRRPTLAPVRIRTRLPLHLRWSENFQLPDGRIGTITHLWL